MTAADSAKPTGPFARASDWARGHVPTRETIEANRFLRPVAHRILVPALWRFHRRSVPRGVALGILAGILFPFAHMALAAVLALPLRANVPTAVGTTLINNPVTFVPILATAYRLGHWVLRLDHQVPGHPLVTNVKANSGWLHWVVAQGGPATIVGLVLIAVTLSIIGYGVTSLIWRLRIARKWRNRRS
ncbi:hypothetical protein GCM10009087_27650 [Sphingomonas oligophenolica]|uniref:DUF2062 domain-containing protein n=1 Tax=Sphingomonas oligophenolica TaxID=301154 RepID=A0ABU9Y4G8_9SPHN